jgi:parallel beta-helix repeat protein
MLYLRLLCLLSLIGLAACGGGGGTPQAPAAPTNVTATPGPGYITVTWQDNSDNETGFVVYRDTAASGLLAPQAMQEIAQVGQNQTTYTDTGVEPGVSYTYAVAAKGASGTSKQAQQLSAPVAPEPDDGGTTVTVSVSPPSIQLAPGGKHTFTASVEGTENQAVTWSSTGGAVTSGGVFTAPAQQGTYQVIATSQVDPRAQGRATVVVTGTPQPVNRKPVIESFTVTPAEGQAPLEVTFSWRVSDPDGDPVNCAIFTEEGYLEYIGEWADPTYVIEDCSSVTSQTHTYARAGEFTAILGVRDSDYTNDDSYVPLVTQSRELNVVRRTITVTNLDDSGAGSLRQAVVDAAGGARIVFADGLSGTLVLSSPLTLTDGTTITGPGRTALTLSGDDKVKLLTIPARATVTVTDLKLTNGFAANVDDILNDGGAVEMGQFSVLTLERVDIANSKASDSGGGIMNRGGTLTLRDVSLINNEAAGNGGGIASIEGTVTVTGSQLSNNRANGSFPNRLGHGGGLYSASSPVTITDTSLVGNVAKSDGGGVGTFTSSPVTITNATVSNNIAGIHGGGLNLHDGNAIIRDSEINGNTAATAGGVMVSHSTLMLEDSSLANNVALSGHGGGLYSYAPANKSDNLTVKRSDILNNVSNDGSGGGIYLQRGVIALEDAAVLDNSAYRGGGLYGSGTIERSLFARNSVKGSWSPQGAGVYAASVLVANSTFVQNSGSWAIQNAGGGDITLRNNTIVNNSGGVLIESSRNLVIAGNIIARNGTDIGRGSWGGSTINSLGYNLIGDGTGDGLTNGVKGDIVGTTDFPVDPVLDPLADNGGPTQTMALRAGSPAIDHIPAAFCSVTEDQRGLPRPGSDGTCDIGAFEAQ